MAKGTANKTESNNYTMAVAPAVSASVESEANKQLLAAQNRRKELTKRYNNEEKVPMYLSAMYAPYFGKVMKVSINGVYIYFPVDGNTYKIPKTFAEEITARRMAIDAIQAKATRMSNIASNFERTPGELMLF